MIMTRKLIDSMCSSSSKSTIIPMALRAAANDLILSRNSFHTTFKRRMPKRFLRYVRAIPANPKTRRVEIATSLTCGSRL